MSFEMSLELLFKHAPEYKLLTVKGDTVLIRGIIKKVSAKDLAQDYDLGLAPQSVVVPGSLVFCFDKNALGNLPFDLKTLENASLTATKNGTVYKVQGLASILETGHQDLARVVIK